MFWFLDLPTFLAFVSAGILLNLTPGNDVIFTIASTLRRGTRAGLLASLGITLGSLTHVGFAAFGLAAVLAANPLLFEAVRWIGAAYLLWLAWQSWHTEPAGMAEDTPAAHENPLLRGYLTNILNPKVALFILAFLPQFTNPELGQIELQLLVLGLIFASTGIFINGAYALLAGTARSKLTTYGRILNKLSALLFGGLAARLIVN